MNYKGSRKVFTSLLLTPLTNIILDIYIFFYLYIEIDIKGFIFRNVINSVAIGL